LFHGTIADNHIILLSTNIFSQQNIFEKGQIITVNNDTLNVYIELKVTYYTSVKYKSDINDKVDKIKIDELISEQHSMIL